MDCHCGKFSPPVVQFFKKLFFALKGNSGFHPEILFFTAMQKV